MWAMDKEEPFIITKSDDSISRTHLKFKTLSETFKYRRNVSDSYKSHWADLTEFRRFQEAK